MSVFTGAQRDVIGINTVADVTNFAPGFTYDPGNVHAYIRGVGRQSVNVTDDQRVANYEDEFYVYSPYGLDKSSLFLEPGADRARSAERRRPQRRRRLDRHDLGAADRPALRRGPRHDRQLRHVRDRRRRLRPGRAGPRRAHRRLRQQPEPGLLQEPRRRPVRRQRRSTSGIVEGQVDWKPNDKFELWARVFISGWNNRGDAGSRVGFDNGSWDETNLTDANAYVGGGLFVNPNYGYSAITGGNPEAAAAVAAAWTRIDPSRSAPPCSTAPCSTIRRMNNPYHLHRADRARRQR